MGFITQAVIAGVACAMAYKCGKKSGVENITVVESVIDEVMAIGDSVKKAKEYMKCKIRGRVLHRAYEKAVEEMGAERDKLGSKAPPAEEQNKAGSTKRADGEKATRKERKETEGEGRYIDV